MSKLRLSLAPLALVLAVGCNTTPETSRASTMQVREALPQDHGEHANCGDYAGDARENDASLRVHAEHRLRWKNPRHRGPRGSVQAKILGFNDFHGQLSEGRVVGGRPVGGAAVLASYLKNASADFRGRSLIIHAGDHVGASPPESALLQDEPAIHFLNALANDECDGFDRADRECNVIGTLGNHEFDEGKDELLRLLRGGNHDSGPFLENPYRGARFPYVNANVVVDGKRRDQPLIRPFVIRKLGKVKVGVIGAVLKETPTIVTPSGVAGLVFSDEATAINEQVRELRKRGVETIVVTIHQGAFQTSYAGTTNPAATVGAPISTIVSKLDDAVDVVISGHAHGFTNALVKNASGHEILVTQAFSASTAYADIELVLDVASGDVTEKSASIVTTYSDQAPGDVRDPRYSAWSIARAS